MRPVRLSWWNVTDATPCSLPRGEGGGDRQRATWCREEARGAGLTRFGMMVTATVIGADRDTLRQVESTVDSLGTASRIVLRRLWGSQSAGFLAALPLGLVIPAHLKVPASVREAM